MISSNCGDFRNLWTLPPFDPKGAPAWLLRAQPWLTVGSAWAIILDDNLVPRSTIASFIYPSY